MRALAQAHGPEAHGTLLLLLAMPCLLPVPGVGTVLGMGMAAHSRPPPARPAGNS